MSLPRVVILANPDNRRITLFQEALARAGAPPAHVVSWLDLLRDERALADVPFERAILRVESAGESFDVERELLRRGLAAARGSGAWTMETDEIEALAPDRGRILCPRQQHLGFEDAIRRVEAICEERPGWWLPTPPRAILECFDKRATWRRCVDLGLPVPEAIDDARDLGSLRSAMRRRGWDHVFVKVSCSSSASCLAIVSDDGRHPFATTTVEDTGERMYNSLRVRRVAEPARLERLVGFLLREGAQVERAVPKAKLAGAFFDCRVLVVDGSAAFVVVRQSRHPITNLHLGGWRGDLDALRRACAPGAFDAMLGSAERLAQAIGAFQSGIDVMLEPGLSRHRILEANAFGDLLPNLTREGLGVYDWQIRRWMSRAEG